MVGIAVFENLSLRRKCERQTTRNNVPASSLDVHFKRSNLTPVLDCMLQEFNSPLTTFVPQPFLALNIIPNNVQNLNTEIIHAIYDRFNTDLESSDILLEQEAIL